MIIQSILFYSFRHSLRPSIRPKRRYRSNSLRISAMGLKLGGMIHSTIKQIAIKNGCAFHRTLKFSLIGLDPVGGMMTHIRKREEIPSWPGNRWHDVMYHEADHSLEWLRSANVHIFWFRSAEDAVVLCTSSVLWKQTKIVLCIPCSV